MKLKPNENRAEVKTPIGLLSFNVLATEGDLWLAQISTCKTDPVLPDGMSVDGCMAVLLRCLSPAPVKELVFHVNGLA